ncbi:hypothetical protein A2U01_0048127, partial [Trifolium medium]|nr:hypothetical protein [Trifolium medium]
GVAMRRSSGNSDGGGRSVLQWLAAAMKFRPDSDSAVEEILRSGQNFK